MLPKSRNASMATFKWLWIPKRFGYRKVKHNGVHIGQEKEGKVQKFYLEVDKEDDWVIVDMAPSFATAVDRKT